MTLNWTHEVGSYNASGAWDEEYTAYGATDSFYVVERYGDDNKWHAGVTWGPIDNPGDRYIGSFQTRGAAKNACEATERWNLRQIERMDNAYRS